MPSGPTGKPATIYDVAALAQLSIATVSRVLQGTGPVSAKARARVDQAAHELNYVPLRAARSLAVQRHEAHGLVLPDLAGPFYGDLLMGYERWAGEHGQSVVLTVTHGNPEPARTVRDLASRVDGVVVHGNALGLEVIQDLRRANVPVVVVAHPPVTGCDSVRTESAASAERLTTRLLEHGRRDLLFVGDPASSYDVSERYAGFAKALTAYGLQVSAPERVPLTEAAGTAFAEKLLAATSDATPGTHGPGTGGAGTHAARTGAARTSAARTDGAGPSAARTSAARTGEAGPGGAGPSAARTDGARPSAARTIAARTGGARTSAARTGGPGSSTAKTGGPGSSAARTGETAPIRRPDGLVCANDELALAALRTLRAGGIAVPEEIVVTGWDDVMAARYVSPGLTTVRQPMAELGRLAAQRLHERVTGERTRARNDVLPTELVLRDSCGTAPGDEGTTQL